ncbi:hypothetical protein HGRIS_008785 [Hohenbuehelia grisea]|uniref:Uncharacterized protein n=1 Tax=Hohenbuehelia grisea TaxID=104357 RepID=A0ABR3J9K9_9AGAR
MLSRRALRETPRLGVGGSAARNRLPADFNGLGNASMAVEDMPEPQLNKDVILNLRFQLSAEEFNGVSSLIRAQTVALANTASATRDKFAPQTPTWRRPPSPFQPIFARSNQPGHGGAQTQTLSGGATSTGLYSYNDLVGPSMSLPKPVVSQISAGPVDGDLWEQDEYKQNLLLINGWETYNISSPISAASADSEIDELADDDDDTVLPHPSNRHHRYMTPPTSEPLEANSKSPIDWEPLVPAIARSRLPANAGGRPQMGSSSILPSWPRPPKSSGSDDDKDGEDVDGKTQPTPTLGAFLIPILLKGGELGKPKETSKAVRWDSPLAGHGKVPGDDGSGTDEDEDDEDQLATDVATMADSNVLHGLERSHTKADDDDADFDADIRHITDQTPVEWRQHLHDVVMKEKLVEDGDSGLVNGVKSHKGSKAPDALIGTFMDVPTLPPPNIYCTSDKAVLVPRNFSVLLAPKAEKKPVGDSSIKANTITNEQPRSNGLDHEIPPIQAHAAFLKRNRRIFMLTNELSWVAFTSREPLPSDAEAMRVCEPVVPRSKDTQAVEALMAAALIPDTHETAPTDDDVSQRVIRRYSPRPRAESMHRWIAGIDEFDLILTRDERRRLAGHAEQSTVDDHESSVISAGMSDPEEGGVAQSAQKGPGESKPVSAHASERPISPLAESAHAPSEDPIVSFEDSDDRGESDKENIESASESGEPLRKRPRLDACREGSREGMSVLRAQEVHQGTRSALKELLPPSLVDAESNCEADADADVRPLILENALVELDLHNIRRGPSDSSQDNTLDDRNHPSVHEFGWPSRRLQDHYGGLWKYQASRDDYKCVDEYPTQATDDPFQTHNGLVHNQSAMGSIWAVDQENRSAAPYLASSFLDPAQELFGALANTDVDPHDVSTPGFNPIDGADELDYLSQFNTTLTGYEPICYDDLGSGGLEYANGDQGDFVSFDGGRNGDVAMETVSTLPDSSVLSSLETQDILPQSFEISYTAVPTTTPCSSALIKPSALTAYQSSNSNSTSSRPAQSNSTAMLEATLNIARPSLSLAAFGQLRAKTFSSGYEDNSMSSSKSGTGTMAARNQLEEHPEGGMDCVENPKGVPPELVDVNTLILPVEWSPPATLHRYMASTALLQRQVLVRALCNASLGRVQFAERESLGPLTNDPSTPAASGPSGTSESSRSFQNGPDLVLSPEAAVLFVPLLSLPARGPRVMDQISVLSWRYERILVVFEAYPESQGIRPLKAGPSVEEPSRSRSQMNLYAYTPPIIKATRKLRRDLGVAEACGNKRGTASSVTSWAFAESPDEAAMFARLYGDRLEASANEPGSVSSALWQSREEWLGDEALENELELASAGGMNPFAAYVILCQVDLGSFLDLSPDERVETFGGLIGIERVYNLNTFIERRRQEIEFDV